MEGIPPTRVAKIVFEEMVVVFFAVIFPLSFYFVQADS